MKELGKALFSFPQPEYLEYHAKDNIHNVTTFKNGQGSIQLSPLFCFSLKESVTSLKRYFILRASERECETTISTNQNKNETNHSGCYFEVGGNENENNH